MSERRKILRASGLLGALTLLSRFTGLARDIAIAAKLGGSLASDVFYYAFELPNLARRVLGEGALSSIIVPLFAGRRREGGDREAWRFLNRAFNAVALVTLALMFGGMIFAAPVFNAFGGFGMLARVEVMSAAEPPSDIPALTESPPSAAPAAPQYDEAEVRAAVEKGYSLTRLMFPYMVGLALASLLMGICHALGSFGPPAFGSIVLNLCMIAAACAGLAFDVERYAAARWLAWAVLAGGAIRLAIMLPTLLRAGWRWRPELAPRDRDVRALFRMMSVGLVGLSINHVNIAVAGIFAAFLGPGNKTYLVYANRLIQLPMALTATALATAMLPRLTHLLLEGDRRELRDVMGFTKRVEIVFMAPAMLGLMFFGLPIVRMLLERNEFTEAHSVGTYGALLYYAPGLIALGWARLLIPLYHAQKDVATPVKAAVVGMIVNVALGAYFTFFTAMEQRGLALATTAAAFANYATLAGFMRRKVGIGAMEPGVGETLTKCLIAAILSVGGAWLLYRGGVAWLGEPRTTLARVAALTPFMAAAAAAYFTLAHAFRVPDADRAFDFAKRRLLKTGTNVRRKKGKGEGGKRKV